MINGSGINVMVDASTRQTMRLENSVRNIANANTNGFKAEQIYFSVAGAQEGADGKSPEQQVGMSVNYSQGAMEKTGNVLDLAIEGDGFFSVETKDGVAYTRDGRATINSDGELVTLAGECILGQNGRIKLSGNPVEIGENGALFVDGGEVDRLKLTSFQNPSSLLKAGVRLYQNPDDRAGAQESDDSKVRSGYLELSNVQAIQEMVNMINIQRTFESYQKTIQTINDQDNSSTNRVGKLR